MKKLFIVLIALGTCFALSSGLLKGKSMMTTEGMLEIKEEESIKVVKKAAEGDLQCSSDKLTVVKLADGMPASTYGAKGCNKKQKYSVTCIFGFSVKCKATKLEENF